MGIVNAQLERNMSIEENRPWGSFTVLDSSPSCKVKRLAVKPGKRMSLQYHEHRSEHWVVVAGTALITLGDKNITLQANQSLFIPVGAVHRIANPGTTHLEIIEVQYGEYLEEDDIIRLEDDYGR